MRLDVELHGEPGRDEVEHLIDQQRSLGGRFPLVVESLTSEQGVQTIGEAFYNARP